MHDHACRRALSIRTSDGLSAVPQSWPSGPPVTRETGIEISFDQLIAVRRQRAATAASTAFTEGARVLRRLDELSLRNGLYLHVVGVMGMP